MPLVVKSLSTNHVIVSYDFHLVSCLGHWWVNGQGFHNYKVLGIFFLYRACPFKKLPSWRIGCSLPYYLVYLSCYTLQEMGRNNLFPTTSWLLSFCVMNASRAVWVFIGTDLLLCELQTYSSWEASRLELTHTSIYSRGYLDLEEVKGKLYCWWSAWRYCRDANELFIFFPA